MVKIGDIVIRKSYDGDIYFRVIHIREDGIVELVGINYRIEADAPSDDLVQVNGTDIVRDRIFFTSQVEKKTRKILRQRQIEYKNHYRGTKIIKKTGRVLHIDGDTNYLKICMKYYEKLGIEAYGEAVDEEEQPSKVVELIEKYMPDILVITGHDSISKDIADYKDINNYRSSKYFVEATKAARRYEPNMDNLVIFAGACQSHYEELIKAGANFASSPERVMIHALDPVFISEKIAFSSVDKVLKIEEILSNTITGMKGLGGFETRGKSREGGPVSAFEEEEGKNPFTYVE